MFATLHTTAGDIRIELYPNHAPRTVQNFTGLATGSTPWTDPTTGEERTDPLYDGIVANGVDVTVARANQGQVIIEESGGFTDVREGGAGDSYIARPDIARLK